MAEYRVVVETFQLAVDLSDAFPAEVNRGLQGRLDGTFERIAKDLDKGSWEIVSHDLMRIDRHVVVTVVMRRPE